MSFKGILLVILPLTCGKILSVPSRVAHSWGGANPRLGGSRVANTRDLGVGN